MSGPKSTPKTRVERALKIRLYVAGDSPNSASALKHLRALIASYPSVAVELDVIDVLKHPEAGLRDRVLVTPMLIKLSPGPERRIVGTLKDTGALVSALGLAEGS